MSVARIKAEIAALQQRLATTKARLATARGRRTILCFCNKSHAINKLALIVTHHYVAAYGCTSGDYWTESEWQFVCPKTGVRNRLLFDDYHLDWDKRARDGGEPAFKRLYTGLFASSTDEHRDNATFEPYPKTYNNYNVDKNRKRYELPLKPKLKRSFQPLAPSLAVSATVHHSGA